MPSHHIYNLKVYAKWVRELCDMVAETEYKKVRILSSNVHNAWMRIVGGRMKSDYQYSGSIVYNNFPWPTPV